MPIFSSPTKEADGNPATVTGNVYAYGFTSSWNSANRIAAQPPTCSSRDGSTRVHFGDMDGDGSNEHLVLVGEGSQYGVFISAYHKVGYDMDQDGQADVEAEGYAGNGSNGLSMLMIQDNTETSPRPSMSSARVFPTLRTITASRWAG